MLFFYALSHFSKTISQTRTFWELGLDLLEVRVILRGKLLFYGRSKGGLEKWSWISKMSGFIASVALHILPL